MYTVDIQRGLAQIAERLLWEQEVAGAKPASPTIFRGNMKKTKKQIIKEIRKTREKLWKEMSQARKLVIAPIEATAISLCPHCICMTYTIKGKCGKCKEKKCAV